MLDPIVVVVSLVIAVVARTWKGAMIAAAVAGLILAFVLAMFRHADELDRLASAPASAWVISLGAGGRVCVADVALFKVIGWLIKAGWKKSQPNPPS